MIADYDHPLIASMWARHSVNVEILDALTILAEPKGLEKLVVLVCVAQRDRRNAGDQCSDEVVVSRGDEEIAPHHCLADIFEIGRLDDVDGWLAEPPCHQIGGRQVGVITEHEKHSVPRHEKPASESHNPFDVPIVREIAGSAHATPSP